MASPNPKRKPKPKKSGSDKSQSERFKKTARELEAKSRKAFERALHAILPPRKPNC